MSSLPNKLKAIGQGLKAAAAVFVDTDAGSEYEVANIPIKCPHCGGTHFDGSRILMNTSGMSLVGLDWLNSDATVLKCVQCSRIQWFADELEPKQ